jgi:septal ring factor EnvC (AmiA/AmiB activator)
MEDYPRGERMKNIVDVLKQKECESETVQHELQNMQRALERVQRDIDVLRSALEMCAENESEAAGMLAASSSS